MLSDTVLQWANELEQVINKNSFNPQDYPDLFISSQQEETHE